MTETAPREWHAEIGSTQARALALARDGSPPGTRVVAGRQTAGRGRLDHVWVSPVGGLYLSMLLRAPSEHESLLPLAIGAHLAAALEDRFGVRLALKWPNDLLSVGDRGTPRKLSGVLLDRIAAPSGAGVVVVGVGVNVRSTGLVDGGEGTRAVALEDLVRPPPSLELTEELVVRAVTDAAASLGEPAALAATRTACRDRLYGLGRRARVDGVPSGTIAGLGDEGELWLNVGSERVAIRTGDLRVEEDL